MCQVFKMQEGDKTLKSVALVILIYPVFAYTQNFRFLHGTDGGKFALRERERERESYNSQLAKIPIAFEFETQSENREREAPVRQVHPQFVWGEVGGGRGRKVELTGHCNLLVRETVR